MEENDNTGTTRPGRSAGCFRGLISVKRGNLPVPAPIQNGNKGLRDASCRSPPRSAVCRLSR